MIHKTTIAKVLNRCSNSCEGCNTTSKPLEFHHIYFRSQYRKADRDEAWNLAALCHECHASIHDHGNTQLDQRLKGEADTRKPKSQRSTDPIKKTQKPAQFGRCKGCGKPFRRGYSPYSGYHRNCWRPFKKDRGTL